MCSRAPRGVASGAGGLRAGGRGAPARHLPGPRADAFHRDLAACAGGWLDIPPDGTWDATITTPAFVIGLQRRYGLPISSAAAAFDALEARGEPVDRLGDGLANAGSYNKRHNAVVSAVRRMVAACAVGPIVLGDKESPWKTASICDTHVPDVVELEADDTGTGGDTIYEIKVPTPLKKKHAAERVLVENDFYAEVIFPGNASTEKGSGKAGRSLLCCCCTQCSSSPPRCRKRSSPRSACRPTNADTR